MDRGLTGYPLNSQRLNEEVPLGSSRYQGRTLHVCPDSMPIFIHERHKLVVAIDQDPPADSPDLKEERPHAA